MERNRIKIAAWLQAGISILFIICSYLPCVKVPTEEHRYFAFTYDFYNVFHPIIPFFYLHIANIFIQAHGSNRLFSALLSIAGLTTIAIGSCTIVIEDMDYKFTLPYYIMILLHLTLLIAPTLIVKCGNNAKQKQDI